MIQDYFGKTIGHVKRAMLTYGPTGRSRGVATIIFSDAHAGARAAATLDSVKVDNKPMKVIFGIWLIYWRSWLTIFRSKSYWELSKHQRCQLQRRSQTVYRMLLPLCAFA